MLHKLLILIFYKKDNQDWRPREDCREKLKVENQKYHHKRSSHERNQKEISHIRALN